MTNIDDDKKDISKKVSKIEIYKQKFFKYIYNKEFMRPYLPTNDYVKSISMK
ncbi:MAG: hypothetical protein ACTSPY_00060 [Candidatus Helarchaeota archaeon]